MIIFFGTVIAIALFTLIVFLGIRSMRAFDDRQPLQGWLLALAGVVVFAGSFAAFMTEIDKEEAKPFDGYVYKKEFIPAHTNLILSGKVLVPIYVPDHFNMIVKSVDNTESRSCSVTKEQYEHTELGSETHCGGY